MGAWVDRLDVASVSDELDARVFGERIHDDETYDEQYAFEFEEDRSEVVLTGEDAVVFEKVIGCELCISEFKDLSLVRGAVLDSGMNVEHPQEPSTGLIQNGMLFPSILALKMWMKEYYVRHHRPYHVVDSSSKKRCTVRCDHSNYLWKVRPAKLLATNGRWRVLCNHTSVERLNYWGNIDNSPRSSLRTVFAML